MTNTISQVDNEREAYRIWKLFMLEHMELGDTRSAIWRQEIVAMEIEAAAMEGRAIEQWAVLALKEWLIPNAVAEVGNDNS